MQGKISDRHKISGPQMLVPSNFREALRNSNFKGSLVSFLVDYWSSDDVADLFEDKVLYVTDDRCFSFRSVEGRTVKQEENDLLNHFEEADYRIFHHVNSIVTPAYVVIRTRDSDLIVIALGVYHNLQNDLNLWLEIGSFTDNSLEYFNQCTTMSRTPRTASGRHLAFGATLEAKEGEKNK